MVGAGLVAAGAAWILVGHADDQARREERLIYAEIEIRDAIVSYYYGAPDGRRQFPMELSELLNDARGGTERHHLSRWVDDPFTGAADWVAVRAPDGGIVGVHSASGRAPLGRRYALPEGAALAGARRYSDVLFLADVGESVSATGSRRSVLGTPAQARDTTAVTLAAAPAMRLDAHDVSRRGGGRERAADASDRLRPWAQRAAVRADPSSDRAFEGPWAVPAALHQRSPGADWSAGAVFARFCAAHRTLTEPERSVVAVARIVTPAQRPDPHGVTTMSMATGSAAVSAWHPEFAALAPRPVPAPPTGRWHEPALALAQGTRTPEIPLSWIIPSAAGGGIGRSSTPVAEASSEKRDRTRVAEAVRGPNTPPSSDVPRATSPSVGPVDARVDTRRAAYPAEARAAEPAVTIEWADDGTVVIAYSGSATGATPDRPAPRAEAGEASPLGSAPATRTGADTGTGAGTAMAAATGTGAGTGTAMGSADPAAGGPMAGGPSAIVHPDPATVPGVDMSGSCGTIAIRDIQACAVLLREGNAPAYGRCLTSARERATSCTSGEPIAPLLVSADDGTTAPLVRGLGATVGSP